MFESTGIPPLKLVKQEFPAEPVLEKPKAIIECYKEIPCNPCATVCPFDAIFIPKDINVRPAIDFDKCTGCGICVKHCPGLAITVRKLEGESVRLTFPYEFLSRPNQGERHNVVNRAGEVICEGVITRVTLAKDAQNTALITVLIPKEHLYDAITIEVPHGS